MAGMWWFIILALAIVAGCVASRYAWCVSSLERRRRALEVEIVERKQVEEALRASHRRIQDLAGRLLTTPEAERARIARELHDDISQQLALISISLSNLKRWSLSANSQPEVASLQRRVLDLSETIRHLSDDLHPAILQHAGPSRRR